MREWLRKRGALLPALAPVIGLTIVSAQVMAGAQEDQAQTVLAAMREALGGDKKINALKSLSAEGTYRRTMGEREMSGDYELALQFPDKFQQVDQFTLPTGMPGPRIVRTFNGTIGWIDAPAGGFRMGPGGGGMNIMIAPGGGAGAGAPPPPPPPPGGATADQPAQGGQRGPGGPGGPGGGRRGDPTPMIRAEFYRAVLGVLPVAQGVSGLTFTHAGQAESNDGKADVLDVKGEGFAARLFVDSNTHLPLMLTYMAPQMRAFTRRPDDTPETIRKRMEEERAKPPQLVENTRLFLGSQEGRRRDAAASPHPLRRRQDDGGDRDQEIQGESHAGSADVREKGERVTAAPTPSAPAGISTEVPHMSRWGHKFSLAAIVHAGAALQQQRRARAGSAAFVNRVAAARRGATGAAVQRAARRRHAAHHGGRRNGRGNRRLARAYLE